MSIDLVLLTIVADWCVNLSAGWFGAAFIVPAFSDKPPTVNRWLMVEDLLFAVPFLGVAYILNNT